MGSGGEGFWGEGWVFVKGISKRLNLGVGVRNETVFNLGEGLREG